MKGFVENLKKYDFRDLIFILIKWYILVKVKVEPWWECFFKVDTKIFRKCAGGMAQLVKPPT
jgi:hypothetical protein